MHDSPALLLALLVLVLLAACGDDADGRVVVPRTAPAPAPAPPADPAEPMADARLALLLTDDRLVVVDPTAPDGAPSASFPAVGTERILDASTDGRFLLADQLHHQNHRVALADASGTTVISTDETHGRFLPSGGVLTMGARLAPRCGGAGHAPFARIRPASGERPREIDGSVLLLEADGALIVSRHAPGPCGPGGGIGPGATVYERVDIGTEGRARRIEGALALTVRAGERVVATLEVEGGGLFGPVGCTLVVGGQRHALRGAVCATRDVDASKDGRFVAVSVVGEQPSHAALGVYRVSDGALVGTHDAGAALGTVGIGQPAADACFSHDGAHLVVSRADATAVATVPEGGELRALGQVSCIGWSPDDRFLLLRGAGDTTSHHLVTVANWRSEQLPDAWDARFLPPRGPSVTRP